MSTRKATVERYISTESGAPLEVVVVEVVLGYPSRCLGRVSLIDVRRRSNLTFELIERPPSG